METLRINDITPAEYNPRRISESAFSELQGSIKTLGFILPIIVNRDNMTIVAGHQRTKACKTIGVEEVPAYFISGVSTEAEIKFNQIHNGVELEPQNHGKYDADFEMPLGFHENVPSTAFNIPDVNTTVMKDISYLLIDYGNPLCAIVCGGEVVFGNNYIRACQLLSIPCNVNVIPASHRPMFDYYFTKNYGEYSYCHIERRDYVQGLAQMVNKKFDNSQIYKIALPFIDAKDDKNLNIFDFGCGLGYSIRHVREVLGYKNAIGLEFFNNNRFGISIEKGQRMIDDLITHVKAYGLFDVVICDSVLNSVNSQEAEDAVLACLLLFCKPGGMIFFCGRDVKCIQDEMKQKRNRRHAYSVRFLDEHGLSGVMREGQWYYQKFHSHEDVDAIINKYGLDVFTRKDNGKMWQIGAKKTFELPADQYMDAIDFEFNMTLPGGIRYGRHREIRELFGYCTK